MSSLSISSLQKQYPGKPDKEIACELVNKCNTMIAVVRYKSSPESSEYTNFGTCDSESEIQGYFDSPYCHETELLIDRRVSKDNPDGTASPIKSQEIVNAFCNNCSNMADERSLTLDAGNNFYVCAQCQDFYCESCLSQLPLSEGTHGVALCPFPSCNKELIRALPGACFNERSFEEQLEESSPSTPSEKLQQEKVSQDVKSFFKKVKSIFNKDQDPLQ